MNKDDKEKLDTDLLFERLPKVYRRLSRDI